MKQERDIEQELCRQIRAMGGKCPKWTSPGETGVPDRICLLPHGVIAFVETKRPKDGRLAPKQRYWRRVLRALGFSATVISTPEELEELVRCLKDRSGKYEDV